MKAMQRWEWRKLSKLEAEIERLRREMVELAMELGLNHPKVHKISQYLDALLLKWHQLNKYENKIEHFNHVYHIRKDNGRLREKSLAASFT